LIAANVYQVIANDTNVTLTLSQHHLCYANIYLILVHHLPFGCVQIVEAVKLFEYLNESGVTPDQRSFELMITAHVVNRDIPSASAILASMVSTF